MYQHIVVQQCGVLWIASCTTCHAKECFTMLKILFAIANIFIFASIFLKIATSTHNAFLHAFWLFRKTNYFHFVAVLESSEWPSVGLFTGMMHHLGNWDECLRVHEYDFRGQYCLPAAKFEVDFEEPDIENPEDWIYWPNEDLSVWRILQKVKNKIFNQFLEKNHQILKVIIRLWPTVPARSSQNWSTESLLGLMYSVVLYRRGRPNDCKWFNLSGVQEIWLRCKRGADLDIL